MKKQKGQSLVEFALVFPFFLLLILALIYSGMLFYDYSTLSSITRSAARYRAISPPYVAASGSIPAKGVSDDTIKGYFYNKDTKKFKPSLITGLYVPQTPEPMSIYTVGDDIVVTVSMALGERSPIMEIVLPDQYSIVYHMKKDFKE